MFDKKSILITGGTGSFGKAWVRYILKKYKNIKRLVIFSRDELKQFEMQREFSIKKYPCMRYFIGDVRDSERLAVALRDIDFVIHAAALKQVPTAEYNPIETIKTNIIGAQNLIESSLKNEVKKVIALSTDKASNPVNLYGATKLVSDKLFIAANNDKNGSTKFSVVRYGNVAGSRGSIIPFFQSLNKKKFLPITDKKMTRFLIKFKDAIELVNHAILDMVGGEIYVKKIPSMTIMNIVQAISESCSTKVVGIRPGEKLHEQMIGIEDAPFTYEYEQYFKILPVINDWFNSKDRIKDGLPVDKNFHYSSYSNTEWMSVEELQSWMKSSL